VREQPGRALRETLVGSLKTKRVLLVLDNCEHLLDACSALLAMLVPACPDLRVLATSREPLGLAGEQTIRVGSLAMPEEAAGTVLSIDALLHFDAVALLVERAQLVNPDFVLSNANAADALAICRRLDGIPLAIELAAARLKVLSVAQVLERLKDRFKLLTTGSRAALPRHQTLRATLDWSHDHLSDAERVLYRRLAIFAGGCTLESAEAVCSGEGLEQPDILDLLTHLVDKSLLVACESQGEPRYRYLESVRQHAQEKLDAAGEVRWIRQRHCDLFVALAEQARPELAGGQQATWLQRLEQEHEELRAAQDWCQEASDAELSLRLVAALQEFWSMRGYWHEGRHRVESALDAAGSAGSPGARAAALSTGSWLALQQGDLDAAHRMESAALPLWRERGVVRGMAKSLNALANVAHYRGDQATARQLYAEALELDRSVDDRRGMAQILGNLGNVAFAEGDLASARSLHQQSLDMKRSLRDSHGAAMSLNNLGNVAVAGGDMASARAFHEESLALRRELGDRHGIAMSLNNLGSLLTTAGDLQMARSLLEESLSLHESLGDRRGIGYCLAYMSMLALASGDLAAAGRLSDRGLAIRRDFGDHRLVAQSLSTLVDIALARGDLCGGRALVAACLHELRTAGDSGAMVGVACRGAKLAIACGQPAVAAQLLGAWAATVGAGDDGPWPTDVGADAVARACEVLGATAFTSAIAAGRRLSLEDALMLIDVG
jgi:predicted ATPase